MPHRTGEKMRRPRVNPEAAKNELAVVQTVGDWFRLRQLPQLTGRGEPDFDRVLLKELVDNALDAAEDAGRSPSIEVETRSGFLVVRDNGDGMDRAALEAAVNLAVRAWGAAEAHAGVG
jgi:hypothetical protein